jgi:hypothetical protein
MDINHKPCDKSVSVRDLNVLDIEKWCNKWKFAALRDTTEQSKAVSELIVEPRIFFDCRLWPFNADVGNNILWIRIKHCLAFSIDLKKREGMSGELTPKVRGCDLTIATKSYLKLIDILCVGVGAKSRYLIDAATVELDRAAKKVTTYETTTDTTVPLSAITVVTHPGEVGYYGHVAGYIEPCGISDRTIMIKQQKFVNETNPRGKGTFSHKFIAFADGAGEPYASTTGELINAALRAIKKAGGKCEPFIMAELAEHLNLIPIPIQVRKTFDPLRASRSVAATRPSTTMFLDYDKRPVRISFNPLTRRFNTSRFTKRGVWSRR